MKNTSWITICISIVQIIVTTVVALIIASLHRKQMRQIELHRENPSVPLIPPPHLATRFILRNVISIINVIFIISVIGEVAILIWVMLQKGPITRGNIFNIAFATVALAYILITRSITPEQIYERMLKIYGVINDVLGD